MFEVEDDVPMPKNTRAGTTRAGKYPFADMKVGSSFQVPCDNLEDAKKIRASLNSCAARFVKTTDENMKFQTRILEESVGIWRTA